MINPHPALAPVAAAGRTGAARFGGNGGALHFRNGRVVGAELIGSPLCQTMLVASGRLTPAAWAEFADAWSRVGPARPPMVPPATGLGSLEWAALSLEAILEAAFELLSPGSGSAPVDLVFHAGGVPGWTGSGSSVTVEALSAEIARRQSVLDRLRPVVTPDSAVERACPDWLAPVQVTAGQWRVLAAIGAGGTARSIAAELGCGVFATTLAVRTLMTLGMVTTRPAPAAGERFTATFPATLFSDAVLIGGAHRVDDRGLAASAAAAPPGRSSW
jgi:hypothetical protein